MSEVTDPFTTLTDSGYVPRDTEQGYEIARQLGRINAASDSVSGKVAGAYLRLLVGSTKLRYVRMGGPMAEAMDLHAHNLHSEYWYPKVLEGVTTEDILSKKGDSKEERKRKSLERNSRSNFARTAASTLITWLKNGGDISTLDPSTVTKSQLTADIKAHFTRGAAPVAMPIPPATDINALTRRASAAYSNFVRALTCVHRSDPGVAEGLAAVAIDTLSKHFIAGA